MTTIVAIFTIGVGAELIYLAVPRSTHARRTRGNRDDPGRRASDESRGARHELGLTILAFGCLLILVGLSQIS